MLSLSLETSWQILSGTVFVCESSCIEFDFPEFMSSSFYFIDYGD